MLCFDPVSGWLFLMALSNMVCWSSDFCRILVSLSGVKSQPVRLHKAASSGSISFGLEAGGAGAGSEFPGFGAGAGSVSPGFGTGFGAGCGAGAGIGSAGFGITKGFGTTGTGNGRSGMIAGAGTLLSSPCSRSMPLSRETFCSQYGASQIHAELSFVPGAP